MTNITYNFEEIRKKYLTEKDLYEVISEKEVQYLKKNIELSLKLIDSEELYC